METLGTKVRNGVTLYLTRCKRCQQVNACADPNPTHLCKAQEVK